VSREVAKFEISISDDHKTRGYKMNWSVWHYNTQQHDFLLQTFKIYAINNIHKYNTSKKNFTEQRALVRN